MKEIVKDRIKEIEKSIPVSPIKEIEEIEEGIPVTQIIYGYKSANEKQELLYEEYLLLKQLDDLYSSSEYRIIVK